MNEEYKGPMTSIDPYFWQNKQRLDTELSKFWDEIQKNLPNSRERKALGYHIIFEAVRTAYINFIPHIRDREICICAAIKMNDGYIIRGHRHHDCMNVALDIERYIKSGPPLPIAEQGFITSKNRFVNRKEAFKLQIDANIPSFDNEYRGDRLYSEDLY